MKIYEFKILSNWADGKLKPIDNFWKEVYSMQGDGWEVMSFSTDANYFIIHHCHIRREAK